MDSGRWIKVNGKEVNQQVSRCFSQELQRGDAVFTWHVKLEDYGFGTRKQIFEDLKRWKEAGYFIRHINTRLVRINGKLYTKVVVQMPDEIMDGLPLCRISLAFYMWVTGMSYIIIEKGLDKEMYNYLKDNIPKQYLEEEELSFLKPIPIAGDKDESDESDYGETKKEERERHRRELLLEKKRLEEEEKERRERRQLEKQKEAEEKKRIQEEEEKQKEKVAKKNEKKKYLEKKSLEKKKSSPTPVGSDCSSGLKGTCECFDIHCPIEDEDYILIGRCGHTYHKTCLDRYFKKTRLSQCPMDCCSTKIK